ncbi:MULTISPECIES: gamma-glutamylcyclotransferase family protein [unclassified Pseudomonas]|uniref:gamma-glutamylcyclotransferase family protein n=1 Tax=unclassified Pseudomonas TaxID=196821 RepID=UPI000BD8A88B|nr:MULTISPECIES: gamma-glutamylcyclotransferase family protein [unclassified Pseudomonas]PVZ19765.1 gamma-glutamyl AIG2-like cyclotransferase [Pseudomonas sp. URIL14HWK12:I12]PVZ26831.1 gamma-glutamyl AIG2-like cyclotransferase [Pseudomonas sp. URIL14HWK12:I10]PVZ37720.1 gamma-glutamyl AIG2-like cyclotransferase [Pseudomonas sp. URIL14HWK12:I11]SNZ05938.1 Gamma-glutamyl cyclotransferase, AIG2-like [Pseudomonas sp. URIL14HWK12:I9]
MSDTVLLFSYGTLQDEAVQLANFGRRLAGQPDALVGYRQGWVEITDPLVLQQSGQTHHPIVSYSGVATDQVPGTVFEITAQELAAADGYEVADYQRVSAALASGAQAWVYVRAQ